MCLPTSTWIQKPQLVLGMSLYKYLTQGSLQTRMRYRLVNVAGRDCVYEQHQQSEHSATMIRILGFYPPYRESFCELAEGTYEIHVDIERDGMWLDRWNANTLRRRITLYRKAPTTGITKPALSQGTGGAAASSSSDAVYGLDGLQTYQSYPAGHLYPEWKEGGNAQIIIDRINR